jgi:hypothetical protein
MRTTSTPTMAHNPSSPLQPRQQADQTPIHSTNQSLGPDDAFYAPWPPVEGYAYSEWDQDGDGTVSENADRGQGAGRGSNAQQVDAECLLSLCEADGFSLQMLNDMLRFDGAVSAAIT